MIPATSLEAGLLILAVEFALIACGVTFAVLHRSRSTQQHQATEITGLVNKVAATTDVRREALSAIFAETYRFDPAETERVVTDFIERERAFYNAMIGVHLGRGGKTLEDVPTELTKVIAPWLRLTPRNMVSVETVEALETARAAYRLQRMAPTACQIYALALITNRENLPLAAELLASSDGVL